MRKELRRMHWRAFKLNCRERFYDALNMLWPIFVVSGMVTLCFKFWFAVWGMF